MKRFDALVVDVDEVDIVELLEQEMRGIVVDRATLVAADGLQKSLEGGAVKDVFAGMDFVSDVAARLLISVEDRPPAAAKLREGRLDETGRALRPGVDV